MVEHIEDRPDWRCRACREDWPCPPAKVRLRADLSPTTLRIHMWVRIEVAAQDMPDASAKEMFDRFLWWTGVPLDGHGVGPRLTSEGPSSGG